MPIAALVLAYLIGYLAVSIAVPAGIGTLDAGLAGALALYGSAPAHVHAIALWVPALGGLYAYFQLRPRLLAARAETGA